MKKATGLIVLILIFGVFNFSLAAEKVTVTFTYEPFDEVDSLHVAGSFNGWSTTSTPMQDEDRDGVYKATVELSPGNYGYRYVIDGEQWVKPPHADTYGKYGYGDNTGVVYVQGGGNLERNIQQTTESGDGEIAADSLKHDKNDRSYANPLGKRKICLQLRTEKNDVKAAYLHYDDGEKHKVKMEKQVSNSKFDYYQVTIQVDQRNFGYQFQVKDGSRALWYDGNGVVNLAGGGADNLVPINYLLTEAKQFTTPDWVQDAVFYQIFPDRFYNGDFSNDPQKVDVYKKNGERYKGANPSWTQGVLPERSHVIMDRDEFSNNQNMIQPNYGYHVFYGGDLQGVEKKIPYLKRLGVNAIYFNPLFEAVSNHKYNISNYKAVEDHFAIKGNREASEEYVRELIKKLHQNGIKVIFDITFNYTGYEHWAFQDVVEKGADSSYSDWYFVDDYPVTKLHKQGQDNPPNYKCWWGQGAYPILNVNNSEVKDYLFEVTKKWMDPDGDGDSSDGIDGWRLDMPKQVKKTNNQFWQEWRKHVKSINPKAYIAGEMWEAGSEYLQGAELDSIMNYRFQKAVVDFIGQGKITADEFGDQLASIRKDYPRQSNSIQLNLIDSHDTKRFLTAAGGNKERLKLGSLLQMTYLGAPLVYYGDEVGMKGGLPPDSHRTMLWSDRGYTAPDRDLFTHYQRLIEIRHQEPALRRGKLKQVPLGREMVYGFKRIYQQQELLVLINAGEKTADLKIPVEVSDGQYRELYGEETVEVSNRKLQLTMEPLSGAVVRLKTESSGTAKLKVTAERNARLVLRGEMNNWGDWENGEDIKMNKNKDGTWSVVLSDLTPGETYAYKYALEYKNTNVDIGSIGPDTGGDFTFTPQGETYTIETPFTKQELKEEQDWFRIEEGTVTARGKTANLGETMEVGVPAQVTVENKYHKTKTVTPNLDIGEKNEFTVKLDQLEEPVEYTFTFDPDDFGNPDIIEGIWLKGSFDAWQEHKMNKKGNSYQLTLKLYPGEYNYIFYDKAHKSKEGGYRYYKDNGSEFTLELTGE